MNKLLVICGPTASGKTSLGIKLAQKFNGEIISADSRQVYQYLDIGTGKDLPQKAIFKTVDSRLQVPDFVLGYYLFEKIPVWLLDVAKPNQEFNVAHYTELAWRTIKDIWLRKKLPILIGGTGFYIKAVVDGIGTLGIPPNRELRWHLRNSPARKLFNFLSRLDPEKAVLMNISDRQNPRRLIRAIEIAQKLKAPDLWLPTKIAKVSTNTLLLGLTAPYTHVYQKIDQRVDERIKQRFEDEIKKLLKMDYRWDNSVLGLTIGYKEWQPYFEGKSSKDKVIETWKFSEHAYVRRQITWFKKDKRINWFDIRQKSWQDRVEKLVGKWYSKKRK